MTHGKTQRLQWVDRVMIVLDNLYVRTTSAFLFYLLSRLSPLVSVITHNLHYLLTTFGFISFIITVNWNTYTILIK